MAVGTLTNSWQLHSAQTILSGTFYVCLLNGSGSISRSSTAAQFAAIEVVDTNYSRQSFTFDTSLFTYNTGNQRIEINQTILETFTASSAIISYDAILIWKNADSVDRLSVSSVNASTNRLTVTSHGRTDGDKCTIVSTVSTPSGTSAGTLYYIKSIDANTIELYSDSGLSSIVDFSDTGSGTIRLKLCNGEPAGFYTVTPTTINIGQSQTISIDQWAFLNTGLSVGA